MELSAFRYRAVPKMRFPPSDEGNQNVVADSASKHAVTLDEPILLSKEDVIK